LLEKSPGNSDILYALGILGLQNNDLKSAETYFKQLSNKDKRSAEANYYLGQIAERRGDLQEAIDWFSQIKSGSYYVESQLRIATLKVKVEGLEPALKYLRTIQVQGEKQQVRLLLAEGEIIREAGDFPRAMKHFNEALDAHPNNTDLLYARALIAEKIDRLDILMRDLQAILDVKPDHAHALNALGYTLADRTARYKEALKYIQRALELKPNDAAVVDSMGWVQYRLGNYDQSISYLRRALQMNRDAEIAAHLGEVLLANGNKDEAHEVIKAGLEISPDNKQLLELLKQVQP
jgi:tetratricopeptide (TPR) repeat protein